MTDIVTSALPFWDGTRAWILARPLSGFAESFSRIHHGGRAGRWQRPAGTGRRRRRRAVRDGGRSDRYARRRDAPPQPGGYACLPPGSDWTLRNRGAAPARFHWFRKLYERVEGLDVPEPSFANEQDAPIVDARHRGRWATTRFVDPDDLRHDMHVNIVTFEPGGVIPFAETHVMEHGLYVLEGKAVYRLNQDWVEVEAGDFMWLRAFCPQACYAGGPAASATCSTRTSTGT